VLVTTTGVLAGVSASLAAVDVGAVKWDEGPDRMAHELNDPLATELAAQDAADWQRVAAGYDAPSWGTVGDDEQGNDIMYVGD
jgi:hypothetical protein